MTEPKDLPEASKDQPSRPENGEGNWAKIAREAYVFGGGTVGGAIKESVQAISERPKETAVGAAASVGIGVALTMAKAGPMPVKLLGAAAGAYFTYGTVKWLADDVLKPERWQQLGGVWSDTWKSSAHTDQNFSTVQGSLGRLSFDTALMVGGGALGSKLGGLGLGKIPLTVAAFRPSERLASEHLSPEQPAAPPEIQTARPGFKPIAERLAEPVAEPIENLSHPEVQAILHNLLERNPGPEAELTRSELQAIATRKRDEVSLPFGMWNDIRDLTGKPGWQIKTVSDLHQGMTDQVGNLRPEMFDRLEIAWNLRDAFDDKIKEGLRLTNVDDTLAAEAFVLDGIKSKEELANYAKIYEPAFMAFMRNGPEERLGPHVAEFSRLPFIDELSREHIGPAFRHYALTGEKPVDAASLKAAAEMHHLDPTLPAGQAVDFQTKPLKEQLTAVAAWNLLLAENNVQRLPGNVIPVTDRPRLNWSDPDVRAAYDKHYADLEQQGRGAIVTNLTYNAHWPIKQAAQLVHGSTLSKHELEQLGSAFLEESINPFKVIATVKPARFQEALKITSDKNAHLFNPGAPALKLAVIFKGSAGDWVAKQAKLGRNTHDAVYWLPMDEAPKLQGLDTFLFNNAAKPLPELEIIAGRWSKLSQDERQMPFSDLLYKVRSESYAKVEHPQFAAEASQWGIKQEDYENFEQRFVASLDTPSPFPLDKTWASGGLTGRFLPRSDTRGLFLGQLTNCCQHPKGEGKTAAWYGQESPQAGFFVVEDANHQVVAQSFAWVSENGGLVFDNVEAKGLGKREPAVQSIYQNASTELAQDFGVVTLGTGAGDMNTSPWSSARQLAQPLPANGVYSDAHNQVLLAKDDAALERRAAEISHFENDPIFESRPTWPPDSFWQFKAETQPSPSIPLYLQAWAEAHPDNLGQPRTFTSPIRPAKSALSPNPPLPTRSGISLGSRGAAPPVVRFSGESDE